MSRNILLVEDDDVVRAFVATLLESAGHNTVEANTSEETFAALGGSPFDLVVLDQSLKGNESSRMVLRIREEFDGLPVLLISGAFPDERAEGLIGDGRTYFLQKPFRAAALNETLGDIFGV